MNEKLSVKTMSLELEGMRNRIRDLEQKLEAALMQTISKLKGSSRSTQMGAGHHMDELVISVISNEYRKELITKTAYFRAEDRGFIGGDPEQDWLEAEAEVDRYLMEQHAPAAMETKSAAEKVAGKVVETTRKPGTLTLNRP
ncbi:MAG: DUF2934 domain-containing protein [Gammaproteobacteria bacterium]